MILKLTFDTIQSPVFNMAADLFRLSICTDPDAVYLRLYSWSRPTVSLGYMQKAEDVLDLRACEADGVGWIRRITGGRAVLHWNDLTYSVVFSHQNKAMGRTVAETYKIISDCLIAGLSKAGIETSPHDSALDTARARSETKLPCFLAPNRDELMVNGKKLIGSAQKRTNTAVLQHGSIPLTADFAQLARYSKNPPAHREAELRLFRQKCTFVNEVNPGVLVSRLAESLADGFKETLGVFALKEPWSGESISAIEALAGSSEFKTTYSGS